MILKTAKLHSVRLMVRPAQPEGVTPAATHTWVCYRGPVVGLHPCASPPPAQSHGCSQRISERNEIFRLSLDADLVAFVAFVASICQNPTDWNKEGQEVHDENCVVVSELCFCENCLVVLVFLCLICSSFESWSFRLNAFLFSRKKMFQICFTDKQNSAVKKVIPQTLKKCYSESFDASTLIFLYILLQFSFAFALKTWIHL